MKRIQRFPKTFVLAGVVLVGSFGTAITVAAQDAPDLQTPKSPLVLKSQGSFFVGGQSVPQTPIEAGNIGFGPGHVTVNQMYVEYMVPQGNSQVPVVMVHGATLSGKSWE